MLSEPDVLDVLHLLANAGATVWVDGGWGVDALVGETTRAHSDLDLVVLSDELDVVRTILAEAGFTEVVRDWLPTALAVADGAGREIDLHPITGSSGEGGYQLLPGNERFHYPPPTTGMIGGHEVQCVDAATQVQCHLGYEPTEKDRRDMLRLRASTNVRLPKEYLRCAEKGAGSVGSSGSQDAGMRSDVVLQRLDEDLLQELLEAAVADADPREVMPPVAGPSGWTSERRVAFLRFHQSRSLSAEPVESTYAIVVGKTVVGAARLCPMEDPVRRAVEVGVWIGRSHRGSGVGRAVLHQLLDLACAEGFDSVFASTKVDNAAAQRLLTGVGGELVREGDAVVARVKMADLRGLGG
ncbi:GNAT family N-acetyltransferase [Wenjunlia vitaminophila]|nr:GNAT family N-acetyltransferase [Wenjunlia vitaminophila]